MKVNYFYVRDKHNFPVACIATTEIKTDVDDGIVFAWSVWNPLDRYSKERARQIAGGRVKRIVTDSCLDWLIEHQSVVNAPGAQKEILKKLANFEDTLHFEEEWEEDTDRPRSDFGQRFYPLTRKEEFAGYYLVPGKLQRAAQYQLKISDLADTFGSIVQDVAEEIKKVILKEHATTRAELAGIPVPTTVCERDVPIGHAKVGTNGTSHNSNQEQVPCLQH